MIKMISQNKTCIEADILCINLTPNQYNALSPAIVYVSNGVTISGNFMTSQMNTIAMQRTSLRAFVKGTELVWKSRIDAQTYLHFVLQKGLIMDVLQCLYQG